MAGSEHNRRNTTAVIVVDLQGDFTTWKQGALAVEGADEAYVSGVDVQTRKFKDMGLFVVATQDWHPQGHISFVTSHEGKAMYDIIDINGTDQILWPPHCVQGSVNADLLLEPSIFHAIIQKGMHPAHDSYSGFQDDGGLKTELDQALKEHNITRVVVYGLATDYCVRATALDAMAAGYETIVIKGLCRGVAPDTTLEALEALKRAGIKVMETAHKENL